MIDGIFLKNAQIVIGATVINFSDYEFKWSFADEGDVMNVLTLKIPNIAKDTLSDIKKESSLIFSFGYGENVGVFITGSIIGISEVYVGINRYLTIKAQQADAAASEVFISKSYAPATNASAVILDLCRLAGFKIKTLSLRVDIRYLTGTQRYGNVVTELQKIAKSCGSSLSISGTHISITHKGTPTTSEVVRLDFTSGLLNEPEKCTDKSKTYDYKITAMASPDIENGTILYIQSNTLNTYVRVSEFIINDFIATYSVEVI